MTGATGFLGKVVLEELSRRCDELRIGRVWLPIRERRGVDPHQRFREELLASACFRDLTAGWADRIEVIAWDLTNSAESLDAGLREELAAGITHVIHCAASVDFHLPVAEAAASNVTSALNVLALARELPRVQGMVSVSTAYVTPHTDDEAAIEEERSPLARPAEALYREILEGRYDEPEPEARLLDECRHPNTYTLTKCIAEHLLMERRGAVPLALVRPSVINASFQRPFPGWIDSPAAFALFAMGIGTGRMRAVIGRPSAHLDLIPVDAVADRVIDAAFEPALRERMGAGPMIRHAVAGVERSPSIRRAAYHVQDFFARNPTGDGSGPVSWLHYLGPAGLRYRFHHWHQHHRRKIVRPMADRLAETNERFAYFTTNTFRFRSSVPLDDPDWDVDGYLESACAGIYRQLMGGDKSSVPLAGRGYRRRGGDALWALRQPRGNVFIRATAYAVAKTLHRAADLVTVDVVSFREALAATPPDAARVIAPSHRSYLDFVLVSFLCFARPDLGLAIPHVAAAIEFSRIPLVGWLLERMHAFYLERGRGREDKALTQRIHGLVKQGRVLELFVEGRRSRSRRFLPPRRGLLRSLQATGHRVALLPVAISYDHVPEEASFVQELRGAPAPTMRLRGLLGWALRLVRGDVKLGRIHVACGRPVALDLSRDVGEVSWQVIDELQSRTVVTTHQLRAFLAATRVPGLDLPWLVAAVERRGGRVLEVPSPVREVGPEVERCMREHFIDRFAAEALARHPDNPAIAHRVSRGPLNPQPDGVTGSPDPRVETLLAALFEPVCRDHIATALALAEVFERGDAEVPGAAELLGSLPGAHRPDVEDAYEALFERDHLARDESEGCFTWGARASALRGYAACCTAASFADSSAH